MIFLFYVALNEITGWYSTSGGSALEDTRYLYTYTYMVPGQRWKTRFT